jgi:membrane associated rhomboid family serine protease
MIPYTDDIPARRFPWVTTLLIVANFAVFILYELPDPDAAIRHASFYPCEVENACNLTEMPWGIGWVTAMFMHAGWEHILGNMWFLLIFGKNVENAFGKLGYLLFYFAGGFAATVLQSAMTLMFGTASDAQVPTLGASGAIAAVLGAYYVLYPNARILTLLGWFPIRIPAWVYLGGWFLYQFFMGNNSLVAGTGGSGVAFFAHVGGFAFGVLVTVLLKSTERVPVDSRPVGRRQWQRR